MPNQKEKDKMKIREDILFKFWNEKKYDTISIMNDTKDSILFFHPQEIEKNIQKIEAYCPKFYGEQKEGNLLIMEKADTLSYLNHKLELIESEYPIITHFNGKIIIERKDRNNYTIKNNCNQTLFENAKYNNNHGTTKYKVFQKDYEGNILFVVSKNGSIHISNQAEIEFIGPYFYEHFKKTELYIFYDENFFPIASATSKTEFEERKKELEKRKITNQGTLNPLEEKRQNLYQEFLYLQWYKSFGVKKQENENYIQTLTMELRKQGKDYAYNLETDQFVKGNFQNCLNLEGKSSTIQIENWQELENAMQEYKRTRELIQQSNQ